jgi:ABC-type branched-subunit amino acid transport system substrate-binding protein
MKKILFLIFIFLVLMALILPACTGGPASAKEPFKVGMTATMTGRVAGGYLPLAEGFRIYIEHLNASGGVDGRKIELYLEDDRSEGGLSVSNIRKFTERDVDLLVVGVISALFEGTLAEAKAANTPAIYLSIGHATKMLPPTPDPLMFGSSIAWGNPANSLGAILTQMFEFQKPPFKLGILTIDSPNNRVFFPEYAFKRMFPGLGLEPAMMQYLSPAAPDPKPFALKFNEAQVDAVVYAGPSAPGVAVLSALRQLGWDGLYGQTIGEPIEAIMGKVQGDEKYILQSPYATFDLNLKEHGEIKAAAEKYGVTTVNSYLVGGWVAGQAVAEILKRTGYPATTEKMLKELNSFKYSLKPLAYGVEWSSTDHAGPHAYQHWWWDASKGGFTPGNWVWVDSEGFEYKVLGPKL